MILRGWVKGLPPPQRVLPLVSLLLVVTGLGVLWLQGAQRPYIEDNFLYSADLVATDNFYDAANQRYSGDRYSNGKMYYQLEDWSGQTAAVRAVLDVTSVTGTKVAGINWERDAYTQSGIFVPSAGDTTADEHLFAPRNLSPSQDFTYRHILYDKPATMHYAGQESLYGLRVFRYDATFPTDVGLNLDRTQTANPASSTKLTYNPRLQIWVEPATGWLIKFEDNTLVTVADSQTGKTLRPFNRFSAHYSDDSIVQQVAYARALKYRQTFGQRIAPSIILAVLLVGSLIVTLRSLRKTPVSLRFMAAAVLTLCVLVFAGWAFHARPFVTLFVDNTGVDPFTAICFGLAAVCILLIHQRIWRRASLVLSVLVGLIGIGGLLAVTHIAPASFDNALYSHFMDAFTEPTPSRMSAYTAAMFILLGIGLLKVYYGRRMAPRLASFVAGVIIALGFAGLLLQLLQIEQTFALSLVYPLSLAVSVMFILTGAALLVVSREQLGASITLGSLFGALLKPALYTIPLLLIGTVAQFRQNTIQAQLQSTFVHDTTIMQYNLHNTFDLYGSLLVGAQGLFAASQEVDPGEWHAFVGSYDIAHHYPGVHNLGYAQVVSSSQAGSFTAAQQRTVLPGYAIYPASTHSVLTPVTYIEPRSQSQQLLGYDLFTDDVRSAALQQARDDASISVTGKISLAGADSSDRPGLMLVMPVYQNGAPVSTVSQRQAAIRGYVFAAIDPAALVGNLSTDQTQSIDFQIYDGTQADSEQALYDSALSTDSYQPRLTARSTEFFLNHPLTITYQARPAFSLTGQQERSPAVVLVVGSGLYLAGLAAVYLFVIYRRQTKEVLSKIKQRGAK